MKAFVTGATGFVGSHLVDKLIEKGIEPYCLRRKTSNIKWLEGKPVKFVDGDLFSNEALEDVIKDMDYVFHVAGLVKAKNKEGFIKGNHLATKNLVEITRKVNPGIKKFVHISSLAVCGPTPTDKPLTEDYEPKPMTTYAVTKLAAEEEVMKYKDEMNVTIIRPPAVYGPRDTEIFIYFQTFKKGLNSLIGFGEKYLTLSYVKELVDGIILAAEKDVSNGQIYFIGSDKPYNWDEIGSTTSIILGNRSLKLRLPHFFVFSVGYMAEFFGKIANKAVTLNVEKVKDITAARWVCSNEKAKKELGYNPTISLEDGFRETVDWYKKEGWL
jgi:nucleoside-diphosphate-sugar epimerase